MSVFDRDWTYLSLERVGEGEGDLLWVTLDNDDKANALSPPVIEEITALYESDLRAEGVRAVLLRSVGKNFSAGADLDHLKSLRDAGPDENRSDSEALRRLFASVLWQPALTVAVVQGACVAGGCGLATAHDYVVASAGARFLYSEVKIGFVAALVATYLPLRVKGRDLREMLLDPQFLGADEALEIGLINRVASPDQIEPDAQALAEGILRNASSESIARTKTLLLDTVGRPLADALERAAEANAESRATDDCRHGIATFLETKRPPRWR